MNSLLPKSLQDKSNLAIEECIKTALDIDITKFMVTPVQNVNDDLLPVLAKENHILGVEGWNLAEKRKQKENLIINSTQLHSKKGSKPSIINALKQLNIEAEIQEWFNYDGKIGHFQFDLIKIYDRSFTNVFEKLILETINAYKPARAVLDLINYYICSKGFIYINSRIKTLETVSIMTKGVII